MDKYIVERRARIRLAWFKRYEEIGNISQVCREFGISRKPFYKWWPCYVKEGLSGLKDRSKRPKSHYGPCRLRFYLERDYGIKLSIYGIYRVLVRAGEIKPRKHHPRRKSVYYHMDYPGQRVQIDAKYMPKIILKGHPEPYKECQYTTIDDCTRLSFVWVYQELCPANSVDFARRMLGFFPFPIEEVQADHGTEFTYVFMPWVKKSHPFEGFLREKGIRCKCTRSTAQ